MLGRKFDYSKWRKPPAGDLSHQTKEAPSNSLLEKLIAFGAGGGLPSLSLCFEVVLKPESTPSNSQGCSYTQNCDCGDDLQVGLGPMGSFVGYKYMMEFEIKIKIKVRGLPYSGSCADFGLVHDPLIHLTENSSLLFEIDEGEARRGPAH